MTNGQCHAERVLGAPMLGVCSKPKDHANSADQAEREHLDEEIGERWAKSQ